ncbi:acetate/propionate family kinase [Roseateles sp.]|uniref:acetate/propionate family kinase n=1 Tax=Roseateles sp. TaxID=1971397 RepID=UPI0032654B33
MTQVSGNGPTRRVLALNSGSSSLKFGLYNTGPIGIDCLLTGEVDSIGEATAGFHAEDGCGHTLLRETTPIPDQRDAVRRIGQLLTDMKMPSPSAIGHRIVHGGPRLREHCLVEPTVLEELEAAISFAPVHTPAALSVLRYAAEHFPGLPQAVCFDTTFHARMPPVASTLPLPQDLGLTGFQRYGFHGLSCESIVQQLGRALPARLLIAHLGNGASVTAVRNGVSIDTSMGLTPTGGLIMGTRSGDLDPGVLVHLMRTLQLDATAMEELLDRRSGMLGISGLSGDLRSLHAAAAASGRAQLAIKMFCYAAAKQLGAMSAALNGVDLIVFTGGIGEHDAQVRSDICSRLAFMGVLLDEPRNRQGRGVISSARSPCEVQVLPSQEDEQIARHTAALCRDLRRR